MYFTWEQMILQVIKFLGEKMDDGKCLFSFEILFLILLCKCFKSYKERDNLKRYMKELHIYLYYFYIFILIFHMRKYRDVTSPYPRTIQCSKFLKLLRCAKSW